MGPLFDKNKIYAKSLAESNQDRLKSSRSTGKRTKLVMVAVSKVKEVNQPNAWVLPNPLATKMMKPAISTREVYTILIPVSRMVSATVGMISPLFFGNSCL